MKKSVKLILILAIAAVVLFAAGAYILIFQTHVTSDFYVKHGDSALAAGNYKAAVRYYSSALQLPQTEPSVAVSLAEAYVGAGNFTKAEYTLVNAITKTPDLPDLYLALSKTYVQQGKFLDADRMLSRIADETVRAALDAQRPQAPTLSPESGFYATYITVTAKAKDGTVYLTTTGAYPSNEGDLYSEPIELPLGETTVCALTVNDLGLVSPVCYAGYTIAGVVEPITLTDASLDSAVRAALNKNPEDTILTSELWEMEELSLSAIADASQLSAFTGLKHLTVENATASDFSSIGALTQMETLQLSGCILSADTVSAIGKLTELKELYLSGCAIGSIEPLKTLTKLTTLDLSNNNVSSLAALSNMKALATLKLHNDPITDIAPLSGCTALKELDVSGCSVTSLAALSGMKSLETLNAADNELTSLSALKGCESLKTVNASANKITEIAVLTELPALSVFDGSYNEISAIPQFPSSSRLQTINLNYNKVTSVKGLSGLPYLNYVHLDYNQVSDLSPLENCANLVQVDAWGSPISAGVTALQNHSIIVNYNPNA